MNEVDKAKRTNAYAEFIGAVIGYTPVFRDRIIPLAVEGGKENEEEAQALTPVVSTKWFDNGIFRDAVLIWAMKQDELTRQAMSALISNSTDTHLNADMADGGESSALAVAAGIAFATEAFDTAAELTQASIIVGKRFDQRIPELVEALGKAIVGSMISDNTETHLTMTAELMRTVYLSNDNDDFWSQFE
jgi:hypothetical protein